jgi:hypothetical protein
MEHAFKIAFSVQAAEKQKFNELFTPGLTIRLSCSHILLIEHATKTASHVAQLTQRAPSSTRLVSTSSPRTPDKPTTLDTMNKQTKAAVRCYGCKGVGHLARVCPTRLNKEVNFTNSPERRNSSKLTRRSRSPGDELPHGIKKGSKKGNKESGKRERGLNYKLLPPRRPW